jgi:hypothetical protein
LHCARACPHMQASSALVALECIAESFREERMQKYIETLKEALPHTTFERSWGALLSRVAPEDIDGEYNRRSVFYITLLWMISAWAALTNGMQAASRRIFRERAKSMFEVYWNMGRDPKHISSTFVDRYSRFNHEAKYGAAGWLALDNFYNYHQKVLPRLNGGLEGFCTRFWMGNMENRQAVTNRLKLVVKLLANAFEIFAHQPEVRLLSIASGSAQAVLGAMQRCPHLNVRAVLVDNDPMALEKARREFAEAGLSGRCELVRNTTHCLEEVCARFRPHIVEMVGFLDYRPRRKAVELIGRIRGLLPEDGMFFTCNINHNREKAFLSHILLWPMVYRNQEEFLDVLIQAGYLHENVLIIYEPFKIHGMAVCRK